MDTRVPADSVPPDAGSSWPPAPRSDDALERRLSALEARLDDLDEAVRDGVPVTVRTVVREELQGVGEEVRRAVSELGRLLLRDLDRLTKVLADHRDTIVERLTGPEEYDVADEPVEAPAAAAADATPLHGEEGRWRVLPARRRRRWPRPRRPS